MTTELTSTAGTPDVIATEKPAGSPPGRLNVVRDVLPLAALLALVVFFSVRAEAFLSAANLTLICGQAGILLLASLRKSVKMVLTGQGQDDLLASGADTVLYQGYGADIRQAADAGSIRMLRANGHSPQVMADFLKALARRIEAISG